jgi:hypothetical protein
MKESDNNHSKAVRHKIKQHYNIEKIKNNMTM